MKLDGISAVVTGGTQAGVRFYFVEYPEFFERDALYGTAAGDHDHNDTGQRRQPTTAPQAQFVATPVGTFEQFGAALL